MSPYRQDPPTLTRAEALARANELAGRGRRVMLGVVGPPGGGKTEFSQALVEAVRKHLGGPPEQAAVNVGMDAFHLAHSTLTARGDAARKGAITTFDADGYVTMLRRIRAGEPRTIWVPEFRRDVEDAVAGAVPVHPRTRVVVTEGNYLLADADPWVHVREILDEVWYLDVPEETRVEWLVERHVSFGRTPEAARTRAVSGVDGANANVVRATRYRADAVVTLV